MRIPRNIFSWLGGAVAVLAVLMMVPAAYATVKDDVITRTFDVAYDGTLTLDTERGSIEVETARAKKVTVAISLKGPLGRAQDVEEILEDFDIEFDHSGKDVTVTLESKHSKHGWDWFGWVKYPRFHFAVTVPEKYNLDLNTAGGSIKIADLEGDVECETSGGSLHISEIKGTIYGRTSGGSITLKGSDGEADLKTSGGGIDIGQVAGHVKAHTSGGSIHLNEAGGEVEVSTSGGSIRVGEVQGAIRASTSGGGITASISKQPRGDCSLKTSGGRVTVYLAKGIKVDVNARTSGGNVKCDMPITVSGLLGKNEVNGKINGGGPQLYLRTSGGPIRIKSL